MKNKARRGWALRAFTCSTCGKAAYLSRSAAKNAIRKHHPGDSGLTAYRCSPGSNAFHIGHLPRVVKDGILTRDEIYRRSTGGAP